MSASQRESIIVHTGTNGDPLVRHVIRVNRVDLEAPWRWLNAGWADLERMPRISLTYGAVFTAAALLLLVGLANAGLQAMILALAGGFLLIGPILAVGLYEGSSRLAAGEPVTAGEIFRAGLQSPGQLALFGLALLLIYLVWVETAFLMFMLFYGGQAFPPLEAFIPSLLFTWHGLGLLIIGTIEGAVLAALVFSVSMVSVPMLMARRVGVATAVLTSVHAVQLNYKPAILWGVLIAALMALGVVTFFLGLVIIFPLIGHATWHAYREIVSEGDAAAVAAVQTAAQPGPTE